ncbi:MAG: hypothetical protein K0S45_1485 [Nitrospira sp.]|jgi:hypothetical protein|nr:hypothetical protein [Nitrospira sp.]
MSVAQAVQMTTKRPNSQAPGLLLQRACACGGSAGIAGECEACKGRKLVGNPLQRKLAINEPGDVYEQEADRVADQVMRTGESRGVADVERTPQPPVQRPVNGPSGGAAGTAPSIVQDVLASSGQPLDAATRDFFEPRFGHDFGNVRVHADHAAAESARSVNALAYTVGSDVVFVGGRYAPATENGRRLLAHELVHVLQQTESAANPSWSQSNDSRITTKSQASAAANPRPLSQQSAMKPAQPAHGFLQRSGPVQLSTTEGRVLPASTQPVISSGAGLPEPDCSTHVYDVFRVGTVYYDSQRPECCFAQIHELKHIERERLYRADHSLEGKPTCKHGDQKQYNFWLGNDRWRIVDIDTTRITVMNLCGVEETMEVGGFGKVLRTDEVAVAEGPATLPERTVENPPGSLGPGSVSYEPECNKVTFTPEEKSKPSRVYIWDPSINEYVDEGDTNKTFTPGRLERIVGITTKVFEGGRWQGERCGEQPPWAL